MDRAPRVVTPSQLSEPAGQQTPGLQRLEAFADEDRWIGLVRSEPGGWGGWHHHGETDTYFYVMRGRVELEIGPERAPMSVEAGAFGFVPAKVVHRERAPSGEGAELVLARIGRGPAVVNTDEPGG